jgi:hypothetical protein
MAITATISLSPSAVQINQKMTATITVSNGDASAVTVEGIRLHASYTGGTQPGFIPAAYGTPNLSAGATTSVAASGTQTFPVDLVFHAPSTGLLSDGSGTFDVNAYVQTSDGSYFSCDSVALASVDNITFADSQQ